MEMFSNKVAKDRIGPLRKSSALNPLREVERYFLQEMKHYQKDKRYKTECGYDVMAQELPYFKTLNYTEYASCFIIHPLNLEMRLRQIRHAYEDDVENVLDFASYFKDNIENKSANKYKDRETDFDKWQEPTDNLCVLVGSNKLKERFCLNRLRWLSTEHDSNILYKPHPITTHQIIGELKDFLGEHKLLPRDADVYHYLQNAHTVFTSHMSETCLYAAVLGKWVEPVEVYQKVHQGSFYHINRQIFLRQADGQDVVEWINKTFSNYKSGIIQPAVDENWREKVDKYLEYIHNERAKYKDWYIEHIKESVRKPPEGNTR
tara:strand:- start:3861 stop:4817 length:957 start_codon:yes stop_codon:yes gene_type:complete